MSAILCNSQVRFGLLWPREYGQASDARIRLKSSLRGWLRKNRTKVAGGPNRDIAAAELCHNGAAILPCLPRPGLATI